MAFERAGLTDEVPPGQIREFTVSGVSVAIANVDGKYHAINGLCLHQGGPLGEGELQGALVTCPWHGWQYDVISGKLILEPSHGVKTYPVEIRGNELFVDIS